MREANFNATTSSGFVPSQLYSTASYQEGDLTGIRLEVNDLSGWNFAGQNLTDASLDLSNFTGADFTGANLTEASLESTQFLNAKFVDADLS